MTNTPKLLSREEIGAIREREQAATVGFWQQSYFVPHRRYNGKSKEWMDERRSEEKLIVRGSGVIGESDCNPICQVFKDPKDAAFIAHARTDIPALLAHIEAQEKLIEELTEALTKIAREYQSLGAGRNYMVADRNEVAGIARGALANVEAMKEIGNDQTEEAR